MNNIPLQQSHTNLSPFLLEGRGLVRHYKQGKKDIAVLDGADIAISSGEMVALVGPSGAGKSTLLHILGLLEPPQSGQLFIDQVDAIKLNDRVRTRLRRDKIGFVYQFHQLLPEFSALENIILPQRLAGISQEEALKRAKELLLLMGLQDRGAHRPAELSGGEQQRVAICRAIANQPTILLADEPTGNLDPPTAERVFAHLVGLIKQTGIGCLIATHNMELARRMDRILLLENGKLFHAN